MRSDIASHARYIEPMLCPRRVKRGHVESSTRFRDCRYTKCRVDGDKMISKRAFLVFLINRV